MKYAIGYNHDPFFLEVVKEFSSNISELYFPAPKKIIGSGRAISQKKDYEKEIISIINICKNNDIESNILLNPTCEGKNTGEKDHADNIISYLKELHSIGLDSVTVANPIHIMRIKKEIPDLKIHNSVNNFVKNTEHAIYLKDLGVDVITIDRDINRDIDLIKDIKEKTGLKIKVLLNEGCLRNCPYRISHFNMISHDKDTDYFDSLSCKNIFRHSPHKALSIPFIRPEDVDNYIFADYLKLATRSMPTQKAAIVLAAYLDKSYHGDILFLLSTKGLFGVFERIDNDILTKTNFFEHMSLCQKVCKDCGYCKRLIKEAGILRKE